MHKWNVGKKNASVCSITPFYIGKIFIKLFIWQLNAWFDL